MIIFHHVAICARTRAPAHPRVYSEFTLNAQRDTYASILGHAPLLQHVATAENVSGERARLTLLERCVQPAGLPPKKE